MDSNRNSATTSNQVLGSQRNGQPPSKKPKLSIEKQTNLSQPQNTNKFSKPDRPKDIYDDIWGDDDFSSTDLDKLEFEETLALSQMPQSEATQSRIIPVMQTNTISGLKKLPNASQTPQSTTNIGFNNKKESFISKTGPRVPLRRTASSGWPSANTFNLPEKSTRTQQEKINGVCAVQSGIGQMKIENENLKEKLNRKCGEVNILRDRVKSTQIEFSKTVNKQAKEFAEKVNILRQEAETTIAKLSKENKSLKSQLDVEVMEREMRINRIHPDSPNNRLLSNRRLGFSSPRANNKQVASDHITCGRGHVRAKTHKLSFELLKELITPELLRPTQSEAVIFESPRTNTNHRLFMNEVKQDHNLLTNSASTSRSLFVSAEASTSREVENRLGAVARHLSESCPSLEPCSISLLSHRLLDINSDNAQQVFTEVIDTCLQIQTNLLHQLNSTVCAQNKHMERETEVTRSGYKNLTLSGDCCLFSCKELFNNERGICARRALALLSLLVEISEFAAAKILPTPARSDTSQSNKSVTENKPEVCIASASNSTCGTKCDSHTTLNIVNDIVHLIEKQRRTLIFEGVLAAATSLMRSLLQSDLSLSQQSREMIVSVLRGVICARPGSLIVHTVLQALLAATKYPDFTDSLCHNSDTCLLQVLCVVLQSAETPKKHILSDVFTCWVLTLFNNVSQSPKWLFSSPSQTVCQCRPLISRLAFTLLGEACLVFSSSTNREKKLLEKLLTRGVLLVCTLLYHDEHFGANVDAASIGYYELFLHSMSQLDTRLNRACGELLKTLCEQEDCRQQVNLPDEDNGELYSLLESVYQSDDLLPKSQNILKKLDAFS